MNRAKFFDFIFYVFAVTFAVLACIWLRFEAVHIGYEIERHKKKIDTFETDVARLEFNVRKYSSLKQIEKIARSKLGMVTPRDNQVIMIKDGPEDILKKIDKERL